MYSRLKNVQVIISLLKQNGIRHLVLSPGTRDVPLVHSVTQDPYFKCYSIVDERSAAYFALGIALQLGEPVCLSCTSSTATSNYMPAVKEAYEKRAQLVLLTADRNNYLLKQGEDQLIKQYGMYGKYVNLSVNLPIVNDKKDLLYCIRQTNEALLALNHHTKGPVQINFQVQDIDLCKEKVLPQYRKVTRVKLDDNDAIWKKKKEEIKKFNRILILFGQSYFDNDYSKQLNEILECFGNKYNCVVSYECTSNINCKVGIKTSLITEAMTDTEFEKFAPDLVITMGNHFFSFIKYKLRNRGEKFEHWRVSNDGEYIDNFDALTTIFQCDEVGFLKYFIKDINSKSSFEYYKAWKKRIDKVRFPNMKFSNFSAIKEFNKVVPNDSLVHLTILNSLRLFNFFQTENLRCFSNLGTDGIDGGISTFLGQAKIENELCFIVSGDLSYFYDLDSSLLKHNSNIRVFLINNGAGSEFHNNFGLEKIPKLNDFIAAGHSSTAGSFIEATDFTYLSANNEVELKEALRRFISKSDKPILLEVFTDANTDSKVLKEFYSLNVELNTKEKLNKYIKYIAKKVIRLLKRN